MPALLLLACTYATDDTVGTFADQNMILALWSAVFVRHEFGPYKNQDGVDHVLSRVGPMHS